MITGTVNGVAWLVASKAIESPDGIDAIVRFTVCGCRVTLVVVDTPSESVAVSCSSRYDG